MYAFCAVLLGLGLVGCGGADLVGAAASGGLEQATWVDERTVVLPRSALEFDTTLVLRAQVAGELSCPIGDVSVADPVAVGELEVVPVSACGVRVYYAAIQSEGSPLTFRAVGPRPPHERAPTSGGATPAPVEALPPDAASPTDDGSSAEPPAPTDDGALIIE
ncbi:MAG: hypothetical protein KC619_07215 [Myxococcales bacterium]|nr:hypothetical protein [Myxococcales bacterium]